jgi:hypothetical protein
VTLNSEEWLPNTSEFKPSTYKRHLQNLQSVRILKDSLQTPKSVIEKTRSGVEERTLSKVSEKALFNNL